MTEEDPQLEMLLAGPLASGVLDFLTQIGRAVESRLFFVALGSALTIPDLMAALASKNGLTSADRYKDWYSANVADVTQITAAECWRFRNAFIHQGRTTGKDLRRVFLAEPGGKLVMHHVEFKFQEGEAQAVDLETFIIGMAGAAIRWLIEHHHEPQVAHNLENFIRRRPRGIPPFVVGAPVIG